MKVGHAFLLPAYLLLCLLLGGASAEGYLAHLALQLLAVLLIVLSLLVTPESRAPRSERVLTFYLLAACLAAALQFLPLSADVWQALGARRAIGDVARELGNVPFPMFVTLLPHETLKSAAGLLPAAGLGLAMLRLRAWRSAPFAWTIVAVMVLSVALGALQKSGGAQSTGYLYENTNQGATVGFFANSNHLATLLLVTLPFLAALVRHFGPRNPALKTALYLICGAAMALDLAGIAANGSLAGYGLVLPVLGSSLLILAPGTRVRRYGFLFLTIVTLAGIALVFSTHEVRDMFMESGTISPEARGVIFANTWRAAQDFLPLGSGLGSFAEVYRLYEDPLTVTTVYINHAHNDYLEVLLEMGIPGGLLVLSFLTWWTASAMRIWRAKVMDPFACAAVIASAAILLHSLVDYPLRTAAVSSIFAVCCVFMAGWLNGERLLPSPSFASYLWASLMRGRADRSGRGGADPT